MKESDKGKTPQEWVARAQVEGRIKVIVEEIMSILDINGLIKFIEALEKFKLKYPGFNKKKK